MISNMRPVLRIATAAAIAVAFFAIGYWFRGFMAEDGCLDAGGRWSEVYGFCERLLTEEPTYPDGSNETSDTAAPRR